MWIKSYISTRIFTFYYFLRCCLVKSHLVQTIQLEWADVEELWSLFWREIQCVNKACGLTYVETCCNVMTASQCQSRSVNRDMEISHGIMQCLPENKMFTSRFSYIEIFFLEYNPYGIYMIVRNIICLSWIIVKDQGTGEVVIASYWESTSVVSRPKQKKLVLNQLSINQSMNQSTLASLCMLKSEIWINFHTINDQPKFTRYIKQV